MEPERRGALEGLRVLECGGGALAPRLVTRILADLGATILAVPARSADERIWGAIADSGKTLASSEGEPEEFLRAADCVVLPDVLDLPERLRAAADQNTRLVQTRIGTGGGDLLACARAAISIILGEPGRPPLHFPFRVPTLQAAWHAAAATLVALRERSSSGRGQVVRVDADAVLATYAGGMSLFIEGGGGQWKRRGFERHGAIYPSGFYPCRDGYVFLATQSRRPWEGFLRLMGDPEWSRADPAFRDGKAIGWRRAEEVDVHFVPWLLQYTRAELVERVRGVEGIILGPIHRADETLGIPHYESRGFWNEVDVEGGRIRIPGRSFRLSPPTRAPEQDASLPCRERADRPSSESPAPRALEGLRVLEFGWNWAGPMVGALLGDFGAEVIKIETRRRQDFMRHWDHARPFFHNGNRNKRSITIDIARSEGAALVLELARHADVVFDNFAAGVLARRGLGPDELHTANPRLVVLSMAMAGQSGPLHHLRGFATMATGFAGLEHAIGYPDRGPTGLPSIGLGDMNGAIQSVVAILAALYHRDRTGEGHFIDVSQIDAATVLAAEPLVRYQLDGQVPEPRGNANPELAPHGIYPTRGDDRWLAIAVTDDEQWRRLVEVLDSPEWARDPSLATTSGRVARGEEIDSRLAAWTGGQDRDELARKLARAGVPAEPVLQLHEMLADRRILERGLVVRFDDERAPAGSWQLYATPWHLERTPGRIERIAPEIGADNRRIGAEWLGRSEDEITDLERSGVMQ